MQVMKQLPLFKRLLQEAASGNDESEDIAKGLARVFAEVGEAYVSLIAAGMPFHHCPRPAVPTIANQVVLQQVQKVRRGDIFDCLRLGRVASPHGTAEAQTMTQALHARWRNVASRRTHTVRAVSVPDLPLQVGRKLCSLSRPCWLWQATHQTRLQRCRTPSGIVCHAISPRRLPAQTRSPACR